MVTIKTEKKEINLVPRTRKVVELTERLKAKNLNELIFKGLHNGDTKTLAEIIKAFAEDEDGKTSFTSIGVVYDFMDDWKTESDKTFTDLYIEVIKVVNEMGFFMKKMSDKELTAEIENPIPTLNMQDIINDSAQKAMKEIVAEEFKGYQG